MQSLEITKNNLVLNYDNTIRLEYRLKITKIDYLNKTTNKIYSRYKIKIPNELNTLLHNKQYLFFTIIDNKIHITDMKVKKNCRRVKIQKYAYNDSLSYNVTLPKKMFDFSQGDYLSWKIELNNNTIKDSTAEIISTNLPKKK